ncbi:hypothetical protein CEXT_626111 [Caerostris extrusa]|uniref:Uncharacterized protein n=1 Tax=Caerostris extrusa TaxID=172846 RepID=A0AAV4RZP5_CAEEX|nr:hypothetical protein CEXT_626111 [Caerostris extrusa]
MCVCVTISEVLPPGAFGHTNVCPKALVPCPFAKSQAKSVAATPENRRDAFEEASLQAEVTLPRDSLRPLVKEVGWFYGCASSGMKLPGWFHLEGTERLKLVFWTL